MKKSSFPEECSYALASAVSIALKSIVLGAWVIVGGLAVCIVFSAALLHCLINGNKEPQ